MTCFVEAHIKSVLHDQYSRKKTHLIKTKTKIKKQPTHQPTKSLRLVSIPMLIQSLSNVDDTCHQTPQYVTFLYNFEPHSRSQASKNNGQLCNHSVVKFSFSPDMIGNAIKKFGWTKVIAVWHDMTIVQERRTVLNHLFVF